MSLLTACQAAVNVTGLGAAPATIIGNTNPLAIQLNYLAERAAKSLRMKPWQAMIREHTITTSAGTENYALPADLAFYVSQTAWDATNYWPMRGSLAPAVWQSLKRGNIAGTQIFKDFRVRGNEVLIFPTPSATETLILEYVRNTPWVNGLTYKAAATADADSTVFPDRLLELELIWRLLKAKGLPYAEEKAEAELELNVALAHDKPAPVLNFGVSTDYTPAFGANVPPQIG